MTHRTEVVDLGNTVNWPAIGEPAPWTDSGEGGLFAYAFWLSDDAPHPACVVDVEVFLNQPDVLLSIHRAGTTDLRERDLFPRDRADWEVFSLPLCAAIRLGATRHSLWHRDQETYFEVRDQHLTAPMRAVLDALQTVYGTPPYIATFLDT